MFCPNCGKELHGNNLFCPNCGAPLDHSAGAGQSTQSTQPTSYSTGTPGYTPPAPPSPEPAAGLATASLVCGILSLVLFCCTFFPLPIAAIVLGVVARMQGNRGTKAKAGIICGIVGLLISILLLVISLIYIQSVYTTSGYYYW